MATIDWTKLQKKFKGRWVALEQDQATVVASGNTAKEVLESARKHGELQPILFRVPSEIIPYIGNFTV